MPHPYCVFLQGMASDLKRAEPSTEASDRVSPSDPDLVAYWTFEEGSGYLVKDVTAHKHDLHIQQPPQWRVSCLPCRADPSNALASEFTSCPCAIPSLLSTKTAALICHGRLSQHTVSDNRGACILDAIVPSRFSTGFGAGPSLLLGC